MIVCENHCLLIIMHLFRVPSDMPLYDILNEFQKGSSHMAAVVKVKGKSKNPPLIENEQSEAAETDGDSQLTTPLLTKKDEKLDSVVVDIEKAVVPAPINILASNDTETIGLPQSSEDLEDGEVIGIITLEDVFEELLQVGFGSFNSHYSPFICCGWM